jgi:hypothetical protein
MSRRLLIAAAIAAPLLGLSATVPHAQSTQTILPGYWEYTSQIRFGVSSSDTENRCVRQNEINRFFNGPSNRHYTCDYPTRVVNNGRMRFEGTCRDRRGRTVGVVAAGTYSPTEFQMQAELDTRVLGITVRPTGTIRARRLSATCPA